MVDFEQAFIRAVQCVFPNVVIHGCFFHFGQCVHRHVQEYGLQVLYSQNVDFVLRIKMCMALAYVPVDQVVHSFESLLKSSYFCIEIMEHPSVKQLIEYFETNWIGARTRHGRRSPMFDIVLWNMYGPVLEDLPRTNNSVEG